MEVVEPREIGDSFVFALRPHGGCRRPNAPRKTNETIPDVVEVFQTWNHGSTRPKTFEMKMIYRLFLPILLISFASCNGYVSGDLHSSNISAKEFPLTNVEIIEENNPSQYEAMIYVEEAHGQTKNTKTEKLKLRYDLPDEYDGGICSIITLVTFGISPCYTNFKGTVNVQFSKENIEVLNTQVVFRYHVFYGWLPIIIMSYLSADNQYSINEGSGISGAMNSIVRTRLLFRIQKLMDEKQANIR